MVKNKGFISLPAGIFAMFIVSLGPWLMLAGGAQFSQSVQYFTEDVNTLTVTQTKTANYKVNIQREANYTFQNTAVEIAENGGTPEEENRWQEPYSYDELKSKFKSYYVNAEDLGLKAQNYLINCQPPKITESKVSIEKQDTVKIEFSNSDGVKCSQAYSASKVYLDNFAFTVEAPKNNYLEIAKNASALIKEFNRIVEEEKSWETVTSTGEACSPSDAKEKAKENAEDQAIDDARTSGDPVIAQAYNNIEAAEFLSSEFSEEYDFETSEEWTRLKEPKEECGEDSNGNKLYTNVSKHKARITGIEPQTTLEDTENSFITYESEDSNIKFNFRYSRQTPEP